MDSTFFIADRLRGIPLVSQRKPTSTTASEDEASKATNSGRKALESSAQSKAVQVEKRDAADMSGAGEVASNQMASATGHMTSGLLFKPAAMTAATSSITKKRPPITSTTRRPKVSASRVSKVVSPSKPESRPTTTSTSRPILAKMLMKAPEPAPHRQVDPSGPSRQAPANSSHLEPESKQDRRLTDGQVSARNNTSPELSRVNQQTMTTQPGFQRRAPQTVSTPQRYTNKLNDGSRAFAGENWVLFNRNDGQMSVFEVMVLMSSIMIFSTVILVILFNWIKSFQSKLSHLALLRNQAHGSFVQLFNFINSLLRDNLTYREEEPAEREPGRVWCGEWQTYRADKRASESKSIQVADKYQRAK